MMQETTAHRQLEPRTAASLVDRAQELPAAVAAALDRYYSTVEQLAELEAAGMTNASIFMRSSKYMYLIHPTQPTGERQREYIGADPTRQAEARARLQRYEQHQQLTYRANALRSAIENASRTLDTLLYSIKEK